MACNINVRLMGGLGNQMFQYAAALALAKKLGSGICLNISSFNHSNLRKFDLDKFILTGSQTGIDESNFSLFTRFCRRFGLVEPGVYRERFFHYDEALSYLSHSATLDGNFISYRYFSVIENDIRQAFQLKDPLSDLSQIVLNDIKSKSNPVSLHIRRGDYASNPSTFKMHGILSENYYKKACHLVSKITDEEPHFFIFSDDLEFSEKSTDYISHKTIVKTNSESPYEDMYLMSMCQNHIIANSTFSWWGAWLNPREDKIVIAPRQWFSDHDLRRFNLADIFPPGWILM